MSRMLQFATKRFQPLTRSPGGSARHECDIRGCLSRLSRALADTFTCDLSLSILDRSCRGLASRPMWGDMQQAERAAHLVLDSRRRRRDGRKLSGLPTGGAFPTPAVGPKPGGGLKSETERDEPDARAAGGEIRNVSWVSPYSRARALANPYWEPSMQDTS